MPVPDDLRITLHQSACPESHGLSSQSHCLNENTQSNYQSSHWLPLSTLRKNGGHPPPPWVHGDKNCWGVDWTRQIVSHVGLKWTEFYSSTRSNRAKYGTSANCNIMFPRRLQCTTTVTYSLCITQKINNTHVCSYLYYVHRIKYNQHEQYLQIKEFLMLGFVT